MWVRKKKNRPVSGFFTKTAYVQVTNFIPVKVSALHTDYESRISCLNHNVFLHEWCVRNQFFNANFERKFK
jgi:hypothetical protein